MKVLLVHYSIIQHTDHSSWFSVVALDMTFCVESNNLIDISYLNKLT